MELADILTALLIAQGSHTGGHFRQATNPDNPMRNESINLDTKKLKESWNVRDEWSPAPGYEDLQISHEDYLKDNRRKNIDIHGAGFTTQDRVRDMTTGKTREDVSKANAIIKALYLAGVPSMMTGLNRGQGDIKAIKHLSGNKYVSEMIGMSILSDLLQKPDSRTSLGFTVQNGAPGLMLNYKW